MLVTSRESERRVAGSHAAAEVPATWGRPLKGRTHRYEFGGPSEQGETLPLFENGMCFRVESGRRWFIYNDTAVYEMHVAVWLGAEADVLRLGRTRIARDGDRWVARAVVYPHETAPLLKFSSGNARCTRLKVDAYRVAEEYVQKVNAGVMERLKRETCEVSHVFSRCYTEDELLRACCHKKVMYVDPMFEPNAMSIQRPQSKKHIEDVEKITWKRAVDCLPKKVHGDIQLFLGDIDPQDIHQGMLADCWFICSLSALAAQPSLVKGMFAHPVSASRAQEEQRHGAYRVTINKHGWWENVILDSYLPTLECQPVFARSSHGLRELWVPLVEKAYAKLHGSYDALIGGDPSDALQDLTGFPVRCLYSMWQEALTDAHSASKLFQTIREYRKEEYLITVTTHGEDPSVLDVDQCLQDSSADAMTREYEEVGLRLGHCYSVLDVREFSFPNVRLLKLRDPLGENSTNWTGAWGVSSPQWERHPLVRDACRPSENAKGTFWMEWGDVMRFFATGGACMVRRNWFDYRVRGVFLGLTPSVVLEVVVTRPTEAFLVLSQRDNCGLPPEDPDALHKSLLITVARYSPERGRHVVDANSSPDLTVSPPDVNIFVAGRDVGMQMVFLPEHSPYYVVPRIMENGAGTPKTFTLGLLTPRKVAAGDMQVNFKRLPEAHKALSGVPEYVMSGLAPQRVDFQRKKPGMPAVLYSGHSIQGAKKSGSLRGEGMKVVPEEYLSSCILS